MDVYIVVRLDLLHCDQSSAVHRDPGEIDWRKCRPRISYNLAPSLHSSLTRQVGSTTILESLLWWHPRHEQWHTSMITSSAFKVNRFFLLFKKIFLLSHSRSWLSWKILHEKKNPSKIVILKKRLRWATPVQCIVFRKKSLTILPAWVSGSLATTTKNGLPAGRAVSQSAVVSLRRVLYFQALIYLNENPAIITAISRRPMQPIISKPLGWAYPIRPGFTMVTCPDATNWDVESRLGCESLMACFCCHY